VYWAQSYGAHVAGAGYLWGSISVDTGF